jgi:hypothetical protein
VPFEQQRHLDGHGGDRIVLGSGNLDHNHRFRWRSLTVGSMHVIAGSAALLVVMTLDQAFCIGHCAEP